jgi:hypothetical protein
MPRATAIEETRDSENVSEKESPRIPTSISRKFPCRAYLIEPGPTAGHRGPG